MRPDNALHPSIDPSTLEHVPIPQIAAHCLSDMTFHGFDETDAQEVLEGLKSKVAELDAMTPERRERSLTPHEEVVKRLKSKFDE